MSGRLLSREEMTSYELARVLSRTHEEEGEEYKGEELGWAQLGLVLKI